MIHALALTTVLLAQQATPPKLVPTSTKVALVPVINTSGEKWQELKDRQCLRANEFLSTEFGSRGFQLISVERVKSEVAKLKIDFTDEEQQNRATLYSLGQACEADVIVFAVITDTTQRLIQQFLSAKREGTAKLKVWVLNVKEQSPYLSAKSVEAKSGGGFFAGLDKGSDRQVIAVANGLRDVLKDFFAPYPVLTGGKGGK